MNLCKNYDETTCVKKCSADQECFKKWHDEFWAEQKKPHEINNSANHYYIPERLRQCQATTTEHG